MTGPDLDRKNTVLGLMLFALFLALFGLTVAAAFIYLALD
jgi:hypothetical protein